MSTWWSAGATSNRSLKFPTSNTFPPASFLLSFLCLDFLDFLDFFDLFFSLSSSLLLPLLPLLLPSLCRFLWPISRVIGTHGSTYNFSTSILVPPYHIKKKKGHAIVRLMMSTFHWLQRPSPVSLTRKSISNRMLGTRKLPKIASGKLAYELVVFIFF